MAIYLDDLPIESAGATLGDVLDTARERARSGGRMVVEVQLDGQALRDDELAQRRGEGVGLAELRLYTADMRETALNTLEQFGPHLADARAAQAEAAELLQQDRTAEAMQRIARAIEVWQQSQRAVLVSSELLGIDLKVRHFEGRPVAEFLDALVGQLVTLRDLLVAGDTVGLADTLAYEWPELTQRWERLIEELRGWIEQGA